ncbi:MAG: tRNA lysidine(34) synthetase TilS [Ruminococcaceae bacterium]|nr:tRNA lysidine(34) synthetase TilS [Oscillospiraceae bacterium]
MNKLPKNFREPHAALGVEKNTPVLVALSGGADSTSLLHMMCVCRESLGFELYAAHVNHNIRTEQYNNEALRDEMFCRELCQKLGVELFVLNADIPKLCEASGESTETVARNVRYEFFASIMKERGVPVLVTAHNANDNLETQIFNLCRGCGTQGISGIPQIRYFEGGTIFRPLLAVSREDILEFCKKNSIEYVTDSTNLEDEYTRNRIRSRIIPELSDIFGNVAAASSRLSDAANEDCDFIAKQANSVGASFADNKIPLDTFNSLHIALKRRILCSEFEKHSDETLEAVHQNALIALAEKAVPHSSVSLPDSMRARIEFNCLFFEKQTTEIFAPYEVPLSFGFNKIGSAPFGVLLSKDEIHQSEAEFDGEIYKLYTSAILKSAKIDALSARSRREGDTIRLCGMTKKIKKLFCEAKIPLAQRQTLPLIVDGDEIIYAPFCGISDSAKSHEQNKLYIYIYCLKG